MKFIIGKNKYLKDKIDLIAKIKNGFDKLSSQQLKH